jgi:hypothetical protein
VTEIGSRAYLDKVLQAFQLHGWNDRDDAAASLTVAVASGPSRTWADVDVAAATPADFLERNGIDAGRVQRALEEVLGDCELHDEAEGFELVTIDDIDSFALVRDVDPDNVAAFARPLIINERVVKHCIHHVIADPYIDDDWAGERSDIASRQLVLDGQRRLAAFLLKGRSVTGPLYGSELGTRGDQITRLLEQRAQLSVIQHVHEIPNETVDQLRYGLISLRAQRIVPGAVGSVWDGVDTARLLLAAGYIDDQGDMTAVGAAANAELQRKRKN